MVILGHKTKIVAEIVDMPNNVQAIYVKNEIFKDIHNNQSIVVFSVVGFPAITNFELTNDNGH